MTPCSSIVRHRASIRGPYRGEDVKVQAPHGHIIEIGFERGCQHWHEAHGAEISNVRPSFVAIEEFAVLQPSAAPNSAPQRCCRP